MINIENLNLDELKKLLKNIKSYKNFKKELWSRWVELFKKELLWNDLLIVEYFWEKNNAIWVSLSLFKKMFDIDVKEQEIKFIENKDLKWWMRIFKNDSMVDISFSKIEKLIK